MGECGGDSVPMSLDMAAELGAQAPSFHAQILRTQSAWHVVGLSGWGLQGCGPRRSAGESFQGSPQY
jgi:hypothetical protein